MTGQQKKPAVICDDRLSSVRRNRLRLHATQRYRAGGGIGERCWLASARFYRTSAVTWPTPDDVRPTARAAPVERSSTRPLMKGPRSLMVTTTLRPLWVTRSLVPNGSERCAAVMSFSLKRWPEAVLLPDSLP